MNDTPFCADYLFDQLKCLNLVSLNALGSVDINTLNYPSSSLNKLNHPTLLKCQTHNHTKEERKKKVHL